MYSKFIKPILYVLFLIIVQFTLVPLISIEGVVPNLPIIAVIYYTLLYGQLYGTYFGFFSGLIFDIASGGLLGAAMFTFTISAFLSGYFCNENKIEQNTSTFMFSLIVFIVSIINCFIYSAISTKVQAIGFLFLFLYTGLLPGIYTLIFSFAVPLIKPKGNLL
ncbi:rod shape-determining protein MreD [Melioribacteraceae bacterium 4301-Me]|uniref:rod shape-determining protein MreD n=1 Tax=Pyranulibacter aquaticus TaxID=3163344 RepID=UPI00359A15E8